MKKNVLNGVIWTFTGTGTQVILQFLVFIILSRLLEPTSFGLMATALAITSILSILSKAGIGPSIVQKEHLSEDHVKTGSILAVIFSLIITFVVYSSSNIVATFFKMPDLNSILKILAFVHLIQGFSIVPEALLQRNLEFKKLAFVQILSYLVYGIVGVSLSIIGLGVWSLVFAYISDKTVKTILLLTWRPIIKRGTINFEKCKELLVFGIGYSFGAISNQVALQGDKLVIGRFLGAVSLGIYTRGFQLFAIPVELIGTVIEKVLFPSFSRIQKNKMVLKKTYLDATATVVIICIPLSLLLFILADDIIMFLFGEKWIEAILPFKILILALLPRVSYKISDSLTKSLGRVYKSANRQLIYGISMILCVSIGQNYGLIGACLGVLIAICINYIYMAQIAIHLSEIKWSKFFKAHLPGIYFTIATIVPTLIINNMLNIFSLNSFIIILITVTVFLLFSFVIIMNTPYVLFREIRYLILKSVNSFKRH